VILFKDGSSEKYSKLLIASGAERQKTKMDDFENVYSLNSVHDHAKIYNAVKNAKSVMVYGSSFEAYELTSSIKELADSLGKKDMQIYLLEPPPSEIMRSFGEDVHKIIKAFMYIAGVKVLSGYTIDNVKSKPGTLDLGLVMLSSTDSDSNVPLNPDVVITEMNLGDAKLPLNNLYFDPRGKFNPSIMENNVCSVDGLFSLQYKNLYSTLFAAGTCAMIASINKENNFRQLDAFYEVDSGFYAGLNMINKRVGARTSWLTLESPQTVIPMTCFDVLGNKFAYIGERDPIYTDVIVEGELASMKFIVYLYNLERQKNSKTKNFHDQ